MKDSSKLMGALTYIAWMSSGSCCDCPVCFTAQSNFKVTDCFSGKRQDCIDKIIKHCISRGEYYRKYKLVKICNAHWVCVSKTIKK